MAFRSRCTLAWPVFLIARFIRGVTVHTGLAGDYKRLFLVCRFRVLERFPLYWTCDAVDLSPDLHHVLLFDRLLSPKMKLPLKGP